MKEAKDVTLAPLISKGQQIQFGSGIDNLIKKGLLKRPITKGGEQLKIPSVKLIQTANTQMVNIRGKKFNASIFTSADELAKIIINGINLIKTIPNDLKDILISYLSKGNYSFIN